VLEASTGEKALSLAADRHPDLVLLDIRLPDISGIEVCRRLRADSSTRRIPIVHISATHITAADEASSLDAGADIYLAEPVGPKELSAAVRTLLRLRSSEQGLAGALQQAQEAQRVAEQALRMKDEFLAILSHELRTPMSAMLGWLHLLKVGKLTPEQQGNALETIERNARIQTQLVNDLLDVSRIVTGKMELDPEVMPLDRALESAIDSARLEGDARRIELKAHLGRGAWHVKGNPGRVQQIFSNLLSNALKCSSAPAGRRRSRSSTRAKASPPTSCRMSSSAFARPTARHGAATAASAWASPSCARWSSCTAAALPRRAPDPGWERRSRSPCRWSRCRRSRPAATPTNPTRRI
jgi:CheY-like chemotaxis protein